MTDGGEPPRCLGLFLMRVGEEQGGRHYEIAQSRDPDASWRDLTPDYLIPDYLVEDSGE